MHLLVGTKFSTFESKFSVVVPIRSPVCPYYKFTRICIAKLDYRTAESGVYLVDTWKERFAS
jgi:hypothetical protein